jgi:predicted alpha/beta superfamily hydrolase
MQTSRGQFIFHRLPSPGEGITRALRIYLPRAYTEQHERRFPVLYLNDGQNVFDLPTPGAAVSWGADAALEGLVAQGGLGPWILVGVDHRGVDRIGDYSPWLDPRSEGNARGGAYAAFLVERLLPFIDRSFRTLPAREHRAIAGSSLGGLISLYAGWKYPEHFSRVGAFSPSVMWAGRQLFRFWSYRHTPPLRIYLDVGSRELFQAGEILLEYGLDVREFYAHLQALGHGEDELRFVLDPRGDHSEAAWRRRLPAALRWLLR